MPGDMLQKFKSSVNRGVTTISVKASSSLEKTKIKTHIESIETDISKLIVNVGETMYAVWESGERDYTSVEALLSTIQQKKAEIVQLTKDMASIDVRDDQILGNTRVEKPVEASDPDGIVCPGCSAVCASAAKFCRKCGHKLQ